MNILRVNLLLGTLVFWIVAHGGSMHMSPAYWIPAFWIPALLVTHSSSSEALARPAHQGAALDPPRGGRQ